MHTDKERQTVLPQFSFFSKFTTPAQTVLVHLIQLSIVRYRVLEILQMLTSRLCTLFVSWWLLALSIWTFISYFHILRIVHFQFYAFVSEMHIELLAKWFLFLICYCYTARGLVSVHASGDFLYANREWVKGREREKNSAFNINKDFFSSSPTLLNQSLQIGSHTYSSFSLNSDLQRPSKCKWFSIFILRHKDSFHVCSE